MAVTASNVKVPDHASHRFSMGGHAALRAPRVARPDRPADCCSVRRVDDEDRDQDVVADAAEQRGTHRSSSVDAARAQATYD
jgi:hypothetical protein